jgi:hypothetical protein
LAETGYLSNLCYSAGLSYGYSHPIAKRLNLEFGIGAGYFGDVYDDYVFDPWNDRYPWQQTRKRHYFGLTKAKIALVWIL